MERKLWYEGPSCDTCGPDGCLSTHPPSGLEQSLEELEFARSACSAAQNGDIDRLRQSVNSNPGSVYHDGVGGTSGYTPLHYAARGGHADCVAFLLQANAPVRARTRGGATPLMRAAFAGHVDVCKLLLQAGSAIGAQDTDGETALHKAAQQGHAAVLALLERHASAGVKVLRNRRGLLASDVQHEQEQQLQVKQHHESIATETCTVVDDDA
jgi:ankyrin repeat protein